MYTDENDDITKFNGKEEEEEEDEENDDSDNYLLYQLNE
jgi:hypothetical protein